MSPPRPPVWPAAPAAPFRTTTYRPRRSGRRRSVGAITDQFAPQKDLGGRDDQIKQTVSAAVILLLSASASRSASEDVVCSCPTTRERVTPSSALLISPMTMREVRRRVARRTGRSHQFRCSPKCLGRAWPARQRVDCGQVVAYPVAAQPGLPVAVWDTRPSRERPALSPRWTINCGSGTRRAQGNCSSSYKLVS